MGKTLEASHCKPKFDGTRNQVDDCRVRCIVLFIAAIVCGWKALQLGCYDDDPRILWYVGGSPHPVILTDGRYSQILLLWALWNTFEVYIGLFHVLQLCLHLLVINELFTLYRSLGIREAIAAVSALFFALFPVYHEAIYWLPSLFYPFSAFLLLLSLRFFRCHLETRRILPLAGSACCYFVACGMIEFIWCFCVVFLLYQWAIQFRGDRGKPLRLKSEWVQFWKGSLFIGVAMLAVALYMFFNHYSNRIERSGGFVSIAQVPSNFLVVLKSSMSWPKRQLFQLASGTGLDFAGGLHLKHGFLLSVLTLSLVVLWLLLVRYFHKPQEIQRGEAATTMRTERRSPSPGSSPAKGRENNWQHVVPKDSSPLGGEGRVRGIAGNSGNLTRLSQIVVQRRAGFYAGVAATSLGIYFLPDLMLGIVKPVLSSRVFYLFFLAGSLSVAAAMEAMFRLVEERYPRAGLAYAVSVLTVIYVLGTALVHISIQDVLCRGWAAQRSLRNDLKTAMANVDRHARFIFVGDTRLVETKLDLKMLRNQLQLDYLLSNLLGVRGSIVDARILQVAAKERLPNGHMGVRLDSGGHVELFLSDLRTGAVQNLVAFGCNEGQLCIYDRIVIYDEKTGGTEAYALHGSKQALGPFSTLHLLR